MSKIYTEIIDSYPRGGFDIEDHTVAVLISEEQYRRMKELQSLVIAQSKGPLGVTCIEAYDDVEAYEVSFNDQDEKVHGERVRTEGDRLHVLDDGIHWTYCGKNRDGVYWETDLILFKDLDNHFKEQ